MKRKDMRSSIIEAVYLTCAVSGLEKATTKKISAAAATSENVIYNYFSSKVELLEAAFFNINCEIDEAMKNSFSHSVVVGSALSSVEISLLLWHTYLDYWVANPKKTVFYDQYIHSAYINTDVWEKQSQSFVFFTQLIFKLKNDITSFSTGTESFMFIMMLIIDSAIMLANNAIKSQRPISEKTKAIIESFICMVFNHK